ncbi:MAG TPA: DNA repair protein RadA [Actinomycetota bacterium]|nr:DNA repair protein RadA [Actinomycetota bacterium]
MAHTPMVCLQCGHRSLQWLGRCPDCSAWDSFAEEPPLITRPTTLPAAGGVTVSIGSISSEPARRTSTGIAELDRVLGGGLVPGSVVLLAGEPGVGKSTLLLQAAAGVEQLGKEVLLVCGEEAIEQVAARAHRLGAPRRTVLTAETEVGSIVPLLKQADVVLVDSIQSLRGSQSGGEPGSVAQVRQCAAVLTEAARDTGAALVLVGHITKEGSIAGPRALEHLVDVVLTFEGDRGHHLRTIRGIKNRYGATGELGVFQMGPKGLSEVPDASQFFLAERSSDAAGSAVGCIIEGRRALALEIQALVMPCKPPAVPRRVAQGLESSRVGVSMAVLQQHCGVQLSECDVYASVAGGLRAAEPAIDLPLCLALASSRSGRPVPSGVAAVGEVGLAGELRSVPGLPLRVNELFRLGFETVIAPVVSSADGIVDIGSKKGVKVLRASSLAGVMAILSRTGHPK